MTRDEILTQLGAIRGICDGLASRLVAEGLSGDPSGIECPHPETMRKDASTLRGPRQFYCQQCKQIVPET